MDVVLAGAIDSDMRLDKRTVLSFCSLAKEVVRSFHGVLFSSCGLVDVSLDSALIRSRSMLYVCLALGFSVPSEFTVFAMLLFRSATGIGSSVAIASSLATEHSLLAMLEFPWILFLGLEDTFAFALYTDMRSFSVENLGVVDIFL